MITDLFYQSQNESDLFTNGELKIKVFSEDHSQGYFKVDVACTVGQLKEALTEYTDDDFICINGIPEDDYNGDTRTISVRKALLADTDYVNSVIEKKKQQDEVSKQKRESAQLEREEKEYQRLKDKLGK